MKNYKSMFLAIFKNKILHFIASRYLTYLVQFVNYLLIALYLGPYYLGVWGFITMILQYINQFNFGIPHSVNAILSVHFNRKHYLEKIVNASLGLMLIFSVLIVLVSAVSFNFNIGEKYSFNQYLPVVVVTGVIGQFNVLFSNIFRVYGRLFEMAFSQTVFPILMLGTILLFKNENLLWALVIVNVISFTISLILFLIKSPIALRPVFNKRLFKKIQIKGWYLFLFNSSFYLMVLSTRSLISEKYPVDEFGYFTFAYSLTNVILLLLQSFSSLIYPKLINRMAHATNKKVEELLNKLRNLYVTTSHILIHSAILLYPMFLVLFPEYKSTREVFSLIALSVVLYTNSYGYSGLLISKAKERLLSKLAVISLISNIILAIFLIYVLKVTYSVVIISTMISYFLFVSLISYYGRQSIGLNNDIKNFLKDVFPLNIFVPYFVSLVLIFIKVHDFYFTIPLLLYCVLNYRNFSILKAVVLEIIKKPNVINV